MFGLLTSLLLAAAQQAPSVPFEFDLPAGYAPFEASAEELGTWVSAREDAGARFLVRHYAVTIGAIPAAVAKDIRDRLWAPSLQKIQHSITPWAGEVDGIEAAGWIIEYPSEHKAMVVLQRIAIQGEAMTMILWEGPFAGKQAAEALLDAFKLPSSWLSLPPPEIDIYRGLGPNAEAQLFPGKMEIEIFSPAFKEDAYMTVRVSYTPGLGPTPSQEFTWQLPSGAALQPQEDDLGGRRVVYRVPLGEVGGFGATFGITRLDGQEFSALNPLWLAMPSPALSLQNVQPPEWQLTVTHLANLEAISTQVIHQRFDEVNKAIITEFATVPAGVAWPFFLIGDFELRQTAGRNWHLRLNSNATLEEDAMREIVRLHKALDLWMPGVSEHWTVASFPWIGDRVMPGLLVLDEQRGWFGAPVDSDFEGLSRRTALAKLLCQEPFGVRSHARGSAALFMESSLAEYAAWRLLETSDNQADADALLASWKLHEKRSGDLPMPLSLLEIGDLYGPRRLLSFGPLVWRAIEQNCGRAAFDNILKQQLQSHSWWTTSDLEAKLKAANPSFDWDEFFTQHVHGRNLPSDA